MFNFLLSAEFCVFVIIKSGAICQVFLLEWFFFNDKEPLIPWRDVILFCLPTFSSHFGKKKMLDVICVPNKWNTTTNNNNKNNYNRNESNINDDHVDDNNIIMIIIIFTFKGCSLNCIKCIDFKCTSSCWLANAVKRSCIGTDRRRMLDFPRE